MSKSYSSFAAVFNAQISTLLGFLVVCFLGISISSFIVFGYSDPSSLFSGTQIASADLSMPPALFPAHDQEASTSTPAEKIIYVSLQDQTLVYLEGDKLIGEFKISSGLPGTPTPPGQYFVLKKKPVVDYKGATYDFENTKWNMMFKTGPLNYYIHGAFWHHNFGHPMSHGCVNVSYADMEGLYNWADEGTKIIIQQESFENNLTLTSPGVYPTPTGAVIASHVTDTSAALSWNAASDPSGVAGYQIYQDNLLVATTTLPKYQAVGLSPGTLYKFEVFGYNQSGGVSIQPESLTVQTSGKAPAVPNFVPNPGSDNPVTPPPIPIAPTSSPDQTP